MSTGINAELGGSLEFSEITMDFVPGAVFDAFGDRWSGTTKYVILVGLVRKRGLVHLFGAGRMPTTRGFRPSSKEGR